MVKTMISKIRTNKKGSYIMEASISLPIFLIAVIVMSSIILMFACIEDANFIVATELRRGAAEAITTNTSLLIPGRIYDKVFEHSQVDRIDRLDYEYRVSRWNQDELIPFKIKMHMKTKNPLNLASEASYDVACVARAYVGKEREIDPMSAEEMMSQGDAVYIFPKSGKKYHAKGCSYLKAASQATILDKNLKNKYSACPLCHSKNASIGSLVYYFPAAGDVYHLPNCSALDRNYIEIEKKVALKRGYTACAKCGG